MSNFTSDLWLDSTSCATHCIRKGQSDHINSIECGIIKYSAFEPSYIKPEEDFIQLGKYRGEDNNFYRYTGMFFFGHEFKHALTNASEITLTFYLGENTGSVLGKRRDTVQTVFNNNIFIKGHSFISSTDLLQRWNDSGYDELKYHQHCPYFISIYEELKKAIINNESSFKITLNEALIKEWVNYDVKGIQIYCHDNTNTLFRLLDHCTVDVIKFKEFYNDIIVSEDYVSVKANHIYDDKVAHIDSLDTNGFFFFNDKLRKILYKAKEIKITFNLMWFLPSDKHSLIYVNNNYLYEDADKDAVILKGHSFKTREELKSCTTETEMFETDKDIHYIEVHHTFKQALDEGKTSYTFTLDEDDINALYRQEVMGLRLGIKEGGRGFWRMSKICNIQVTQYKDDYERKIVDTLSTSWININMPTYVGKKRNTTDTEYAAYYFFGSNLYNELTSKRIQNISIRFYFNYNSLEEIDDNYNIHYYICGHDYHNLDEAIELDNLVRRNSICEFYVKNNNPEYIDVPLSAEQIKMLKNFRGLCIYSKQNLTMTSHSNSIKVFIDYASEEEYTSIREFNLNNYNTYIIEDRMCYENKFICGATDIGYLYKPFLYLGDNFNYFMNKEEILGVKLLIVADHIHYYDERPSADTLKDIEFYTHNVTENNKNYESYKYMNALFRGELGNLKYIEIDLDEEQINYLKNSHGLGAIVRNNTNNDYIVINEFNIIVTYVNLV